MCHAGAGEALRLAAGDSGKRYNEEGGIVRRRTEVEKQVIAKGKAANTIVRKLPAEEKEEEAASKEKEVGLFLPDMLRGALFVGHIVTDLDSVAGAMGAAELYGGTAALASPINSETEFALQRWGAIKPLPVEDLIRETPDADICLVDHQQTTQMNPNIDADRVVGVIDHHALQSKTIVTDRPIYIDIRPWGSMSTIVAHTFLTHGRRPSISTAGMLLCAILSDTLNLQGPTTTDWDRLLVAVLAEICDVDDIQLLASNQFKAKSRELANLSAIGLVNGDQKSFSFEVKHGFNGDVGFAVVETTDDGIIMDRLRELLPEMVVCKKEKGYRCLFLAVVNIVKLRSNLLICGPSELALATEAFGGELLEGGAAMDLGSRVSRKKDFVPVITQIIKGGWTVPVDLPRGMSLAADMADLGKLEVDPCDPYGNIMRRGSMIVMQGEEKKYEDLGDEPLMM